MNYSMNNDTSPKELTKRKQEDEEALYNISLMDPDFTRYKCDPQTLSFMSDISTQLRKLYPNIEPQVKDVLDVGARTAIGSWFLHKLHHPRSFSAVKMNVTAIDIANNFKEYSNIFFPDIEYLVGDIFDLPPQSRDIVICSHTIEHVPDPKVFIEQLCKIAREFVIVACPYEEPASNLIPGHVHSISQEFINQFDCELLEVYTSMHWHQSKACIFAIRTGKKKRRFLEFFRK
jgi:SAM-dependent methyltransferase